MSRVNKVRIEVKPDKQIYSVMENLRFLGHFDTFRYRGRGTGYWFVTGLDAKDESKERDYKVTLPMLRKAYVKMALMVLSGQAPGWIPAMGLSDPSDKDGPIWDALAGDKLLQYAIFGEEIYD